jgi:hypothetical protein
MLVEEDILVDTVVVVEEEVLVQLEEVVLETELTEQKQQEMVVLEYHLL